MSFKAMIFVILIGLVVFSCYNIKNNNPLSRARYEVQKEKTSEDNKF